MGGQNAAVGAAAALDFLVDDRPRAGVESRLSKRSKRLAGKQRARQAPHNQPQHLNTESKK